MQEKRQLIEIERKFLVKDDSYKAQAIRHYEIVQGYICKEPGKTIRVRIRDNKAFLTIKSSRVYAGIARFEWEKEIDVAEAKQLLQIALPGLIEKTRWIVPEGNGLDWEVDEFHGKHEGLVIAEIELEDEQQTFNKAAFIGEEVTGDPRYYNANMI
jgi:CYTH domain-containing protein